MSNGLIGVLKAADPIYTQALLPYQDIINLFAQRTQHLGLKLQGGEFKASDLLAFLLPRSSKHYRRASLVNLAISYVGQELRNASYHLVPGSYVFLSQLEEILVEMVSDPEILRRLDQSTDWVSKDDDDNWVAILDEVNMMFIDDRVPVPVQLEELIAVKRRLYYHAWTIAERLDRKAPLAASMVVEIGADFRVDRLKNRLRELNCPIMESAHPEEGVSGLIFGAFAPIKNPIA